MGAGPSNPWPTFSDYVDQNNPGVAPSASDMNRMAGNFKFLTVPPSISLLRYDTSLVADNQWHNCRFDTAQWDVDAQGGFISPDLHNGAAVAETFTINTTGLYDLRATERFACGVTGYLWLRVMIVSGSELDRDTVPFTANNIYTARLGRRAYLTSGQQIQFQHLAFAGQNVTLYTDNPSPFAEIHYCGRKVV